MGNEAGANELTNEHGEVRSDGAHAVLDVLVELLAVLADLNHLSAEILEAKRSEEGRVHRAPTRIQKMEKGSFKAASL